MSHGPVGHRPGGLTALAVINFVFAGLGALGILGSIPFLTDPDRFLKLYADLGIQIRSKELIYAGLLLGVASAALAIVSGVGYLGQKRFMGKILGTVYALLGILGAGIGIYNMQNFGIINIVGLIYPVLTLILLNTVFKDDFPNP